MKCNDSCLTGRCTDPNKGLCQIEEIFKSDWFTEALEIRKFQLTDFTCYKCKRKSGCLSAFDLYNTDGDCLEGK